MCEGSILTMPPRLSFDTIQPAFTCSESIIETVGNGVKDVQVNNKNTKVLFLIKLEA